MAVSRRKLWRSVRRHGIQAIWAVGCGLIFLVGISSSAIVDQQASRGTLHVVGGLIPPNLDARGEGREVDIFRAALAEAGADYDIVFHAVPFGRHWSSYERDDRFDAVLMVPPEYDVSGNASQSYILYENVVIYPRARFPEGLGPRFLDRLEGRRVVSFPGARDILPGLAEAEDGFAFYAERAYQYSHASMLERGFVDAVIADGIITQHYLCEYRRNTRGTGSEGYAFLRGFEPTEYVAAFRDAALQDAFDEGLRRLRASGRYDAINARYAYDAGDGSGQGDRNCAP